MKTKILWYMKRLSLMNSKEIQDRIIDKVYVVKEKAGINKALKAVIPPKFNKFFFDSQDLVAIQNFYQENPSIMESLKDNAEKVLVHSVDLFTLKNLDLGTTINWHKDYKNNIISPVKYYSSINYKNFKETGDVKYIWELNRFKHLYTLAQAYCVFQEDKYVEEILAQINSWIDDNPYLMGANWSSALELSLRVIAWCWALSVIEEMHYPVEKQVLEKITTSIHLQMNYVMNHLSKNSSANNHLVGEAAGLCVAGFFLDAGKNSKLWAEKGLKIILDELDKQVFEDGFTREQTTSYHMFVFDLYLISLLIARKNGKVIPKKAFNKLFKMANVLYVMSDNKLHLPNIGDADDAIAINLSNVLENTNLNSMLVTVSCLLNKNHFNPKIMTYLDEKALWLLPEYYQSYDQTSQQNHTGSYLFKDSGYFVFKDKPTSGLMDIGPLGYLSIAAHGHADALSIVLNYKDKPFLIDPGTFVYQYNPLWRNYFRSTAAHNTVTVDQSSQSVMAGDFMWTRKADVTVIETESNEKYDYIKASHDGYLKQDIHVVHQREFLFLKDTYLLVKDTLVNNDMQKHHYELNWHCDNQCSITQENDCYKIYNENDFITITIASMDQLKTDIIKGDDSLPSGWQSQYFDEKIPASTVKTSVNSDKNHSIITLITFGQVPDSVKMTDKMFSFEVDSVKYSYNLDDMLTTHQKGLSES